MTILIFLWEWVPWFLLSFLIGMVGYRTIIDTVDYNKAKGEAAQTDAYNAAMLAQLQGRIDEQFTPEEWEETRERCEKIIRANGG